MRALLVLFSLISIARAELDIKPLEAWIARQKDLKSLEADFVQERKLPSLKKPISTPGRLRMERPGKLLWELGQPVKTMAVSDGSTMTLVDVAKKRGKRIDADSSEARQFTMLSNQAFQDLAGFQDAFELVESRVTEGIYQLTVRPKDKQMRKHVSWMFLDIDMKSQELRALDLEMEDKSRIRTVFSKAKINPKIDPAVFTPDLSGYRML
ncbi:outer membrane lipoprotein carrier protein LolA [Luteolibacter sp. GHJ8]|uniref:Outer membrane lipoprotein carrier protein LolA n=1 Tax=Luteolibacter rhizosphaerae TaxID=2989719 RepID=A0ABT3FY35_9BACT|nr:outer membrane lipoprotein carrier protein LolA [Luteolibacter rhizosphaerae]MCW1912487.1 outer membrane lipoprotein carrier protein LolA [Luteolibacter rhizosphaerae]